MEALLYFYKNTKRETILAKDRRDLKRALGSIFLVTLSSLRSERQERGNTRHTAAYKGIKIVCILHHHLKSLNLRIYNKVQNKH